MDWAEAVKLALESSRLWNRKYRVVGQRSYFDGHWVYVVTRA